MSARHRAPDSGVEAAGPVVGVDLTTGTSPPRYSSFMANPSAGRAIDFNLTGRVAPSRCQVRHALTGDRYTRRHSISAVAR